MALPDAMPPPKKITRRPRKSAAEMMPSHAADMPMHDAADTGAEHETTE